MNSVLETDINSYSFSRSNFKKEIIVDLFQIVGFFIVTIYLVFYLSPLISKIIFLSFFILFWVSKKDYLWFALFFVLINQPAFFFGDGSLESINRLPFYPVASGMTFHFIDLFVIVALIKSIIKPKNNFPIKVVNSFLPFLIVALIFGFFMAVWLGTTVGSFLNNFRAFFYITLLYSLLRLWNDKEDLIKFGYLLLPFLFLVFSHQVFHAMTGSLLISFFDTSYKDVLMINTISKIERPQLTGYLIFFYSLGFGFLLNKNKNLEIFPGLSNIIIFLVFVSVFLSATRTWITICLLMLIINIILNKKMVKSILLAPYIATIGFAFMAVLNLTDYFIKNIWSRYYSFLESIFSNQVANYDTLAPRLNYTLPKILEGISINPIFGLGFSDILIKYYDVDLGGLNTVLTFGLIGILFFFFTYLNIFKKIFFYLKVSHDHLTVSLLQLILVIFAGIFLGFFTTFDFFSLLHTHKVFFISIILIHAEIAVRDSNELNLQ